MKADKRKLQIALARRCMNCKDIAIKAKMPEITVRNVLQGRNVRPRTFGKVSRALGVDPREILEEEVAVGEKE